MDGNSGKVKYLAKNVGLLTISNFATKILSFFLVPLYTNILTTTEYGINDLFITTIGILLPIVTLNIQESVLRFALDEKYNKKSILRIGFKYLIYGTTIVIALLLLNTTTGTFEVFKKYGIYFFLMFFSQALSGLLTAYIRGIDRVADLSISSVINSFTIIVCNILFLVVFKWGIVGYFIANIVGPFIQCFYLIFRADILGKSLSPADERITEEMIGYSKPLILNSIAWWINNAADKYVIVFFLGLAENGIYSVAGKIPAILNVFQVIFSQAWTLSAVKEFDPEDKNGFFSKTYATYNCFMVLGCSAIIVVDKLLARLMYAKDFYAAWQYVPWLTIAIVFGSLAGYLGGFFSAVKDSKVFARTTLIGAACNIVLNFALTPFIGAMGAAIATTVSYFSVWCFRLVISKKYIRFAIRLKRDLITYFLVVLQTVILLLLDGPLLYGLEIGLFIFIALLYMSDIKGVTSKISGVLFGRLKRDDGRFNNIH